MDLKQSNTYRRSGSPPKPPRLEPPSKWDVQKDGPTCARCFSQALADSLRSRSAEVGGGESLLVQVTG